MTIEARFTVDNRVWDDFKLSMQEPVKAPAKSGVAAWKTPEEFLRDYKNISVTTAAGGTSTVSLNTYRCAREDDGGLGDALPFLQAVRSAANQAKMKREWDVLMTKASTLVFWGKGAPGDIGKVLSAIDGVASNAAALPGFGTFRPSVDRPNRLQFICDTYLGVDCNGFVGNYARLLGVPDADPELPPPGWLTIGTKNLRESPEEIARGDVVIWAGGVHIALVERAAVEGRGSVLDVVQSTAGGPQLTRRHIALPSKLGAKRFEIRAGSTHCAMLPRDNLIVKSIGLV
ncbi:MAG: hypothetical protein LAQ69_48170 [Acidobacteriia bacterium]|nr:hypothetical protein [Terriglobia bacterium]